jgi:Rod binding domain-containing protein
MSIIDAGSLQTHDIYNMARLKAGEKNAAMKVPKKTGVGKNSKLYRACQEFEAIFIKQMLNVMRKTVNKAGLLDGGFAQEVFEDMLYDEYAKKMAEHAGFGLSDSLYRQLSTYVEE